MGRFWELIQLICVSIVNTKKGEKGDAEMPELRSVMDVGTDRMPTVHTRGWDEVPLMPRGAIHIDGIAEKDQLVRLCRSTHHVHLGRFRHQPVCFPGLVPRILFRDPGHLSVRDRIDGRTRADVVNDENPSSF